ncbi:MAG: hypothetical protein BRC48_10755 [Cyanobacteria bacterium QS_9_48_30]|nr:MAG: hypothetical protein BRC48_10755 [Cyanobacteria bacterium QS_9_48_30]
MNLGSIAAIAYGIIAIIGGIIGYIQARTQISLISLISGIVSGILLILGGASGQTWGVVLATVVAAVLVIVFIIRLRKTGKFMPAGLMIILGLVALAVMIGQLVA